MRPAGLTADAPRPGGRARRRARGAAGRRRRRGPVARGCGPAGRSSTSGSGWPSAAAAAAAPPCQADRHGRHRPPSERRLSQSQRQASERASWPTSRQQRRCPAGPVSRLAVALGVTASLPPGTCTVHGRPGPAGHSPAAAAAATAAATAPGAARQRQARSALVDAHLDLVVADRPDDLDVGASSRAPPAPAPAASLRSTAATGSLDHAGQVRVADRDRQPRQALTASLRRPVAEHDGRPHVDGELPIRLGAHDLVPARVAIASSGPAASPSLEQVTARRPGPRCRTSPRRCRRRSGSP